MTFSSFSSFASLSSRSKTVLDVRQPLRELLHALGEVFVHGSAVPVFEVKPGG